MTKKIKIAFAILAGLAMIAVLDAVRDGESAYRGEPLTQLPPHCPTLVDESAFASAEELKRTFVTADETFKIR